MRLICSLLLSICLALAISCSSSNSNTLKKQPEQTKPAGTDSIGSATMKEDGTIVLQLRAEGPNGITGDALLTYPPDHADYRKILDHVGGLEPGQEKPVPPFPDE